MMRPRKSRRWPEKVTRAGPAAAGGSGGGANGEDISFIAVAHCTRYDAVPRAANVGAKLAQPAGWRGARCCLFVWSGAAKVQWDAGWHGRAHARRAIFSFGKREATPPPRAPARPTPPWRRRT